MKITWIEGNGGGHKMIEPQSAMEMLKDEKKKKLKEIVLLCTCPGNFLTERCIHTIKYQINQNQTRRGFVFKNILNEGWGITESDVTTNT